MTPEERLRAPWNADALTTTRHPNQPASLTLDGVRSERMSENAQLREDLYGKVLAAREELAEAERKFLHAHGWEYTCRTPGSFWLWQKTLPDGRTILAAQTSAVNMAEHTP